MRGHAGLAGVTCAARFAPAVVFAPVGIFRLHPYPDDMLLLTSLASDQAIRTANIVGAMAVVVHNAKPLPQTMCQVADALGIPLVSSPLSKYESCVRIHAALEAEKNG